MGEGPMALTQKELDAMPAKAKREPEVIDLYLKHDFLTAYAMHTGRRIRETSYKDAIGGGAEIWDSHGELQRDFLISQGLRPEHRLMEIGCGTGRLARKVVPYLNAAKYVGVDISRDALDVAERLSREEGWTNKHPLFAAGNVPNGFQFDYVWSFSVMIHVPIEMCENLMRRAAGTMHKDSRFYWSYVPEPVEFRSGVKQFRNTLKQYRQAADNAGLTFEDINWIKAAGHVKSRLTGSQRVALSRLK